MIASILSKKIITSRDRVIGFLRIRAEKSKKRLRDGNSREYITYRATIPKELVEKLELKDGDLMLIIAMKPKWYHLMNWYDQEVREKLAPLLPREVKRELVELGLAPKEILK